MSKRSVKIGDIIFTRFENGLNHTDERDCTGFNNRSFYNCDMLFVVIDISENYRGSTSARVIDVIHDMSWCELLLDKIEIMGD